MDRNANSNPGLSSNPCLSITSWSLPAFLLVMVSDVYRSQINNAVPYHPITKAVLKPNDKERLFCGIVSSKFWIVFQKHFFLFHPLNSSGSCSLCFLQRFIALTMWVGQLESYFYILEAEHWGKYLIKNFRFYKNYLCLQGEIQ